MQLQSIPSILFIASTLVHASSTASIKSSQLARNLTLGFAGNVEQTSAQATTHTPSNRTELLEQEDWPINDEYWLNLDQTNQFLPLREINNILMKAERTLGKRQSGERIIGTLLIKADRQVLPHSEVEFAFTATPLQDATFGDAYMSVMGLTSWFREREQEHTTYFYLNEIKGRGFIAMGALKRSWQPFPPFLAENGLVAR